MGACLHYSFSATCTNRSSSLLESISSIHQTLCENKLELVGLHRVDVTRVLRPTKRFMPGEGNASHSLDEVACGPSMWIRGRARLYPKRLSAVGLSWL